MFLTQILSLFTIMILSRKLIPADFGLVALAYIVIKFIDSLNGQVANYLIFDNEKNNVEKRDTGFWLNCFSSTIFIIIGFIIANNIYLLFDQPDLNLIILLLLIKIPFDSISKFLDSIVLKELNFKAIEIRDFAVSLGSSILSIMMAISGYGVWSLIIPVIILAPIKTIIMFQYTRWIPRLILNIEHAKEIVIYSYNLILSKFSYFIVTQTDNLFIGYFFNTSQLGIYNISWRASNLINRSLVKIVNKLTFPYYSSNNKNKTKSAFLIIETIYIISTIAFPIFIWMIFFAESFILTIYGSQWYGAIVPFQILLIYAIRYSVGSPIGPYFESIGRPDINKKLGLSMIPFYIVGVYYGVNYGIIGVAIAVTFVRTFFGLINFYIISKIIQYSLKSIIFEFSKIIIISIISSVITIKSIEIINAIIEFNLVIKLIFSLVLNCVIFLILLNYFYNKAFNNIYNLLLTIFPKLALLKYKHKRNKILKKTSLGKNKNEFFLISYPKSGNTYLRFLIANILKNNSRKINFKNIGEYVPDTHIENQIKLILNKDSDFNKLPIKIAKSHDIYYKYYKDVKVIYLYRNGIEVLSSYYKYLKSRDINVRFKDLFEGKYKAHRLQWYQHLKSWSNKPDDILYIDYKDLLKNPESVLTKIFKFFNYKVEKKQIVSSIKKCSLKQMQIIEEQFGYYNDNRLKSEKKTTFVRRSNKPAIKKLDEKSKFILNEEYLNFKEKITNNL